MKNNRHTFIKYHYLIYLFLVNYLIGDSPTTNIPMVPQNFRQPGLHNGNLITTEFWNSGSISSPGNRVTDIVWNGLGYGYEFGMFICAEVEVPPNSHTDAYFMIENGDTTWYARVISDGLISYPETSPDNTEFWGWEPQEGFSAPGPNTTIALSDQPSTWAPEWTEWPGEYGSGIILANQESYWVMDDAANKEFEYYPVPEDSSVRGLGLEVSCRGYQFNDALTEDFIIFTYDITNISNKTLNQMQIGIWGDPHIGGASDYSDDLSFFNLDLDLAYAWDEDGNSDIEGLPPGYLGLKYVDTPFNIGVQSFSSPPFMAINAVRNDHYFWENFLQPGSFDSTNAEQAGDYVFITGTGYFSLEPGDTVTYAIAVVLGEDYGDLISNAIRAQMAYDQRIKSYPGVGPHQVDVILPVYNAEVSGMTEIQWSTTSTTDNPLTIDIYYNDNRSTGWQLLTGDEPDDGSYFWDTSLFPDGYNYQLQLIGYDSLTTGFEISDYFIVNNPQNESEMEILFLNPVNEFYLAGDVEITWRAGDADGTPVTVNIYYSIDGGNSWQLLAENEFNDNSFIWDTNQSPNGVNYQLKLSVSDSLSEIESPPSSTFVLYNSYPAVPDSSVIHLYGIGNGTIEVNIVDSTATTGHLYHLTFDDTTEDYMTYDILDINSGELVVEDATELTPDLAGPLFDGLRLTIDTPQKVSVNDSSSGWTSGNPNLSFSIIPFNLIWNQPRVDYEIRFFNTIADTSVIINPQPINFQAWNISDNEQVDVVFYDYDGNGEISVADRVVLIYYPYGNASGIWNIYFTDPDSGEVILPQGGDILSIITIKPYAHDDVFELRSPPSLGIEHNGTGIQPETIILSQNYPNPFNPNTTIAYELTKSGKVQLIIYDLLGRKIINLVEDYQTPGKHVVRWDGTNSTGKPVASGIYYYRLISENEVLTRKMVILK